MAEENKQAQPAQNSPAVPSAGQAPTPPAESDSLDNPASSTDGGTNSSGIGKPQTVPEDSAAERLKSSLNIYFIFFIVIVLIAVGVIVFAVSSSKKSSKNSTKAPTLTAEQLSDLKANTTLVGQSSQTLNFQGNAVFAGQVLTQSDLNVAGALKVGGALSLPTLNVGGTGTFNTLQVNGPATITGNTVLQDGLTVQKNLTVSGSATFGSLSVAALSVTSLNLTGDLGVIRHIKTSGGSPTRNAGTALGGGGTVSVNGSDTAGTVTINTGNSPAAGLFATVNFVNKFASTPRVMITPIGSAAAALNYYVNRDTNGFSVGTTTPPPGNSTFSFDYFVIQ